MPLFWISIAIIIGSFIGHISGISALIWLIFTLPGFLVFVFFQPISDKLKTMSHHFPQGKAVNLSLLTLFWISLFLSAAWADFRKPDASNGTPSAYLGLNEALRARAVIVEQPAVYPDYQRLVVQVQSIIVPGELGQQPVNGKMLLYTSPQQEFSYGDYIAAEGKLSNPAEDSSYRYHLQSQGIYSQMNYANVVALEENQGNPLRSAILNLRMSLKTEIESIFPSPESALLTGILLGDESSISTRVYDQFRRAGASHVIVISGFNISIVISVMIWLFGRRFGRLNGIIVAVAGVLFYSVLTGGDPSVIRSAIMGVMGLAAGQLGRRQIGLNSLGAAAILMILFQPAVILNIGFQLSFLATLGLIIYSGPLETICGQALNKLLPGRDHTTVVGLLSEYLLYTIAANIMVLPVLIYYFGRLSWVLLPVNLLILPVQSVIMIGGMIALGVGLISSLTGQIIGFLPWLCTRYMVVVVQFFAGIIGTEWHVALSFPGMMMIYGGIFIISKYFKLVKSMLRKLNTIWIAAAILILAGLLTNALVFGIDKRLQIVFLDTGEGSSILIKTPEQRYILIGGGNDPDALADALGTRMPFIIHDLDYWIAVRNSKDDLSGFEYLIEQYTPQAVLWAAELEGSEHVREMMVEWERDGFEIVFVNEKQRIDLGQGASLEFTQICRNGAVLLVEYADFRMLLPIGLDFDCLAEIQDNMPVDLDIYLLADGGFAPLNPPDLLEKINPAAYILEISPESGIDRPSAELMEYLNISEIIRTDLDGWISILTDGNLLWIETENQH